MPKTTVLVISDVPEWIGYLEAVETHRPDAILLVGDVVHDGWVNTRPALMAIPAYRTFWESNATERLVEDSINRLASLHYNNRWYTITHPQGAAGFLEAEAKLKDQLMESGEFRDSFLDTHVRGFYQFLESASKLAPIYSVRGDHDTAEFGYDPVWLKSKFNVQEITGMVANVGGLRIAGLGYPFAQPITQLKEMVAKIGTGVDVLACHWEHKHLPRIQEILEPRIVVKGHFGGGLYCVNGTPVIFTERRHHVVLKFDSNNSCEVLQFQIVKDSTESKGVRFERTESWDTAAMLAERTPRDMWPWMIPLEAAHIHLQQRDVSRDWFREST